MFIDENIFSSFRINKSHHNPWITNWFNKNATPMIAEKKTSCFLIYEWHLLEVALLMLLYLTDDITEGALVDIVTKKAEKL